MFGSFFGAEYFARTYFPGSGATVFVEPTDFDCVVNVAGDVSTVTVQPDVSAVRIPPDPASVEIR
jgi:hypothetical protein